jgi:hypothetical protein
MKYIDFISAKKGGLEMTAGTEVLWSDTVEGVALAIYKFGIATTVMGSSTMDFASEEGFANDMGAMKLWKDALERAGV